MFSCTICGDAFVGTSLDTTHATICGHVFHHECLKQWLERSNTCPHCRSIISVNNLIKLFLQVDPQVRIVWNKKAEEEINLLTSELEVLRASEQSVTVIKTKLETANSLNEEITKQLEKYTKKCTEYVSENKKLKKELEELKRQYNILRHHNINLETKFLLQKTKIKSLEKDLYNLQSGNTVLNDTLKNQITALKSQNTYFHSKCHSLESGNEQSTSKMNLDNTTVLCGIQLKNEFRRYDSGIRLVPKKFLTGSVFLFLNDVDEFDETDYETIRLNIGFYGGKTKPSYSKSVTHIICKTQKHEIVQQGIKDNKRCVTKYWLIDIINKQLMLKPWFAHHFPTPYSKKSGLPCKNYQIGIANFDVNDCQRIKTMIKLIGAEIIEEVSSSTNVIISLNLEGEIVKTALERNIPVVNLQWLSDILCGVQIGISDPMHIKYHNFNLSDPFSVSYEMVPHLMEAWKYSTGFFGVQKIANDLVNSPKCKRQKTLTENTDLMHVVDFNDHVSVTDVSTENYLMPYIMFCGFTTEEEEKLKQIVLKLGGRIAINNKGTHLVMKEPIKSMKFVLCLSCVIYIVNEPWLTQSNLCSKFEDELDYGIKYVYGESESVVCNVSEVLRNPMRQGLFRNKNFFITSGIESLLAKHVEEIICAAGGNIESQIRNANSVQNLPPDSYFVITCTEDFHLIADLLKMNFVVYSPEFVIKSVLQQRFAYQYSISPTP